MVALAGGSNPCAMLTRIGEGYIGVKPGPVGAVLKMDKTCPSQARWVKVEVPVDEVFLVRLVAIDVQEQS